MVDNTLPASLNRIEILNAIRANDEHTLSQIYASNYRRVELFVLGNNGSTEDAKDVFQEAFIAMWRNVQMDRFIPENESSLSAYLCRIAQNKWIDQIRQRKSRKTVLVADGPENHAEPELNDTDQELLSLVSRRFGELGKNCREILLKFYYQRQTLRTIAESMSWTEATARNNKYRCIERLRALIKS